MAKKLWSAFVNTDSSFAIFWTLSNKIQGSVSETISKLIFHRKWPKMSNSNFMAKSVSMENDSWKVFMENCRTSLLLLPLKVPQTIADITVARIFYKLEFERGSWRWKLKYKSISVRAQLTSVIDQRPTLKARKKGEWNSKQFYLVLKRSILFSFCFTEQTRDTRHPLHKNKYLFQNIWHENKLIS
jgi:hypothetical protein